VERKGEKKMVQFAFSKTIHFEAALTMEDV
jgi:hypothetical protein